MPLPQLNTNIDYSNALFQLAQDQRARQEQADISQNRNIQTQSLLENRKSQNALHQIQMNKEQAILKEKELETGIKQLGLLNYDTPEGIADHNKYKEYITKINPDIGARIPTFDPADPKSKEAGSTWRSNAISFLTHGKGGGEFDKIEIINPDTGEEKIDFTPKGKSYTVPKGWKTRDVYTKEKEIEYKKKKAEEPKEWAPQRVEAEQIDENGESHTVILSFPAGQTVTQADIEKALGPGSSILSSSDKKKKVTDWNESYEKVLANADKPEIVSARADAYNLEAPGNKVLVQETSHRYIGNQAIPGTEETKYVSKVLPKIGNKQISKKDVAAYAKSRNISYNDALNFILIAGAKSK